MRHFLTGLMIAVLVLLPTSGYSKPCGNGYIEDSDTCHKGTAGGGDGTGVLIALGVLVGVGVVSLLLWAGLRDSPQQDQSGVQARYGDATSVEPVIEQQSSDPSPGLNCRSSGSACGCSGYRKSECGGSCCQWYKGSGCGCRL